MNRFILLPLLLTLCTTTSAWSQLRSVEPTNQPLGDKLWYGGNFILGLSSGNNFSLFQFGLSPMVGYKFMPGISAGPRASLVYNYVRVRDFSGEVSGVSTLTWLTGIFARAKVFSQFFGQVEYAYESQPLLNNDLSVTRFNRGNVYLGAGYNTARGTRAFGTEIMVTYNLTLPGNTLASPFDYRIGFTYNF